jgi:glutamate dehydrogenase
MRQDAPHALIEEAARLAPGLPPNFVAALFGRAAPEDLAAYAAADLAALAAGAFAHLGQARPRGRHLLRIGEPPPGLRNDITLIEIVNDNMPFLLDSTLAEIAEHGVELRLVAHPILAVERDGEGRLTGFGGLASQAEPALRRESLIQIHVERIIDAARIGRLSEGLDRVYADVRISVADWRAMRARIGAAIVEYKASPPPLAADEVGEAIAFLEWLEDDNFTFLGLREYRLEATASPAGAYQLDALGGSGLGTLRDPDVRVLKRGRELVTVTPEVLEFLREPHPLIITKANVKSRVHRRVHMDYIGIKMFGQDGRLEGELRLVGLFTSSAYTGSTHDIPYLRLKVARVLTLARLDPSSHSGKVLTTVLESYPRDELFQVDIDTLSRFSGEIARLYERPRLRVLARPDRFDRFVSILTFIPRDRYDTRVRQRVGEYLRQAYRGRLSAVYPFYPEGPLVRTHYIIGRDEGATPQISRPDLEAAVAAIVRTWSDAVSDALGEEFGDAGRRLAETYATAFSAAYMEAYPVDQALADMAIIEKLSPARPRRFVVSHKPGEPRPAVRLKVFAFDRPIPLSERVPRLEHMGFKVVSEQTHEVNRGQERPTIWLHDMALEPRARGEVDGDKIEAMLATIFRGEAESDGFNALVLHAGLGWREIVILRTLARYLRQIRIGYSQDYMWDTLCKYPAHAKALVELFNCRFDPHADLSGGSRADQERRIHQAFDALLAEVASLDEDNILRRFRNLIGAAVRTNFFQLAGDGLPTSTIALKFDSAMIDDLPVPRPLYEITVYSPRVEGIHLRFGKVARGGLRWSDRPQDFRTEVLGLVKAQQVKNAVIVPVGAKGGFVAKMLPAAGTREAWLNEGIAAYRLFVGTLLAMTDNIDAADRVIGPSQTVCHDGEDPYLVVAADKGTATFSDLANGLALDRHFWLGDAFASGGSAGYDHKKMGITARGAWEAVKRHFREIDIDIQSQPFTVVGIGDMSGDVFGNAMLLSPQIRLVAAFDHRDIFIDPDPDPARSLAERARLFALPRSSWQDYDKALLSPGGGVFSRSAKEIVLSPQVQALLRIERRSAAPSEILRAILKVTADLIFFGGIGTYVRASSEGDEAASDRANDAIRLKASELHCKIIGEGANLGMTQLARIEAAQRGIRLNTDAIDNSAGVNTSDVEVNIKIALSAACRDGRLDLPARNALLASMTDEVAELVLRNNYQQSLALSLARTAGALDLSDAQRLMQSLEAAGRLDRAVEFLPDDATLAERAQTGTGLTRPELAVLLAYAKLALHDELLHSSVPDDPYLAKDLFRYFPKILAADYPDTIIGHRLRRDITATALANALINRGGPSIVTRLAAETGAGAAAIVRSFAVVRDSFSLTELNQQINALDNRIAGSVQLELYAAVQRLLISRLAWFVRHVDFSVGLEAIVARFAQGVDTLSACLAMVSPPAQVERRLARAGQLRQDKVPEALALHLASLEELAAAPDIVLVGEACQRPVPSVAATFFRVDARFGLGTLIAAARAVPAADPYDRLALDGALGDIESARRQLTQAVLLKAPTGIYGDEALAAWMAGQGETAERAARAMAEAATGRLSVSRLVVAAGLIGGLVRAG